MGRDELGDYIVRNGIDATILDLDEPTPTVEAAAEVVGVSPAQIIKSILFLIKGNDGQFQPLMVITNGTDRIDYVALAKLLATSRRSIRIASADQVEELTGFPVGTVPPFGHKGNLPTIIDAGVLQQEVIYGGGGALHALMRIAVTELRRVLPGARIEEVTQSTTTS
jgi:prolyl-tRNA editing enzyme YbaK/EbsC (Cys-tRNA(Pro) deacylase)